MPIKNLFPSRGLPMKEERISPNDPRVSLARPDQWLFEAFGAQPTAVGISVNERSSLKASAVYACVRILAETVASLPCEVFQRLGAGGKEIDADHPLYALLHDSPNPEQSAFTFWETMQGQIALWGNAYAERELNGKGQTIALWPIAPDRVNPHRVNGERVYTIGLGTGNVLLDADHMFHVPGMGFDGLIGYSPIYLLRQAVALSLATEEFGARFFGNGSRPGGVLEHPKTMSAEASKRLKQSFEEAQSGLTNAQRVLLLEEGTTWKPMSIPPDDAQFLETRRFQVAEIARIFRVPPHMLADLERATFSNIEQQSLEFVIHTIRPWLKRWEQSIAHQLMDPADRVNHFVKFGYSELLRGDQAARGAFYTQMFNLGAYSTNDIRAEESMNPVPDGDKRFVPLNMVPLDQAGVAPATTAPQPTDDPAAKAVGNVDKTTDPGSPNQDDEGIRALGPIVADAARRITARLDTARVRAAKKGLPYVPDADDLDYATRALAPASEAAVVLGVTLQASAQGILDHWTSSLTEEAA